jgi:hypothetical protein
MAEWDGICACGKAEADGKRCKLGATHSAKAVESKADDDDLDFLDINDDLDFLT